MSILLIFLKFKNTVIDYVFMYVYVYQKSKSGKLNFGHVKCTLDRGDEMTITSMQHVFFTKASLMGRQCHISSRTASLLLS